MHLQCLHVGVTFKEMLCLNCNCRWWCVLSDQAKPANNLWNVGDITHRHIR